MKVFCLDLRAIKKLDANAARLDPDVYENQEVGFKWDMLPGLSFSAAISKVNRSKRCGIHRRRAERDSWPSS